MAWQDKPTEAQLSALFFWLRRQMPGVEASAAISWLRDNATRHQVSDEMKRVRELFVSHALDRDKCFEGDIWSGYFDVREDYMDKAKAKVRLVVEE